mgnify:CR=1 FL=1
MRVLNKINMQKYIDAHCHLTNNATLGDILTRATKINVIWAINNAAKISDWPDIIEISEKNHDIVGAIGIHPWYISDVPDNWSDVMQDLLLQNPQIQIGEIGLDKHKPDMDLQISVFEQQLSLAHELGRGVSLHCVGAWEHIARILRVFQNKLPCFILAYAYN